MTDSWFGWDWEALAAIGTFAAVLFALWTSSKESRGRSKESLARSGRNVQVKYHVYDEHGTLSWHISNNSTATIFGFRHSVLYEDTYGMKIEREIYRADHLSPGGVHEISLDFEEAPRNMYLSFMDGNGHIWRAIHPYDEVMEAGSLYSLECVTPEDDTLLTRLRRLLRASWSTLRNWLNWKNLKSFGGILTSIGLLAFIFFAGFITGNGI